MKKSIVLIPLPSLIKNSFVRSFVRSPSLLSLMVSVDVKHHVYLLTMDGFLARIALFTLNLRVPLFLHALLMSSLSVRGTALPQPTRLYH